MPYYLLSFSKANASLRIYFFYRKIIGQVCYLGLCLSKFLSSFATSGKDGHELKLQKLGLTFASFNALPAKKHREIIIMISALNLFDIFCLWEKALSKT